LNSPSRSVAVCASSPDDEQPPDLVEDVRDFRARLVAQQRAREEGDQGGKSSSSSGWIYESPLIEQGSVLLGGTKQFFGFGLRQQYFHKVLLLLVQHDDFFTKGIILNRPTSMNYEGWDLWFGGDVQEGGLFRKNRTKAIGEEPRNDPAEMLCLHQLELPEAQAVSQQVIKSIYCTGFDEAKQLVASGKAQKKDFWLFVGYCGWAPGQLQAELQRDSWYMAAADSSVLLNELLSQASNPLSLPRLTSDLTLEEGGDGIATWNRLMHDIGRGAEADATAVGARSMFFEDRMLREWVRQRLTQAGESLQTQIRPQGITDVSIEVGTLLMSMQWPGFVLDNQFMVKSLLLVVEHNSRLTLGVLLNRPTQTVAQLASTTAEMPRRVRFGGDTTVGSKEMYVCLLPSSDAPADAIPLGSSTLSRLGESMPSPEQSANVQVIRGFVYWGAGELEQQLAEGRFSIVEPTMVPWQDLWDLADATTVNSGGWTPSSIGSDIWETTFARKFGASYGDDSQNMGLGLADLALLEWAKFFAQ